MAIMCIMVMISHHSYFALNIDEGKIVGRNKSITPSVTRHCIVLSNYCSPCSPLPFPVYESS